MKSEFYKMEYEAWDEGTDGLSLEEEAAYLRLCHQMYRRRGSIPDHINTLCRIWRCHHNKAKKLLNALVEAGKITVEDGAIINGRVARELGDRNLISAKRSDAGRTGGIHSGFVRRTQGGRTAHKPMTQCTQTDDALHTGQGEGIDATPNPLMFNVSDEALASSTTKERRGEKRESRVPSSLRSDGARGRAHPRERAPKDELLEVLDATHAEAVIDHRQRLRKPLTAHASKLLAIKFAKTTDPNAAADAMVANGWQGFEPEWLSGRNGNSRPQETHYRDSFGQTIERQSYRRPSEGF